MIQTQITDALEIHVSGVRSHLDVKALATMLCQISGRGKREAVIDGQLVRVVVHNDGTEGNGHVPIDG